MDVENQVVIENYHQLLIRKKLDEQFQLLNRKSNEKIRSMKVFLLKKYFSTTSEDIPVKHEELPKITYTLGKYFLQNTTFVQCLI